MLWDNDKYIATININNKKKRFKINVNGLCSDGTVFYNSKGLKRYIKKQCMLKLDIPEKLYQYIDSITVMFLLT